MRCLTKEEIIYLNKKTVLRFGGNYVPPFNFFHEESLLYLVDVVDSEMFGEPLYPEVYQKAGVYLFNIISDHIFTDGNKRTGLDAMFLFLSYNHYQFSSKVSDQELIEFILELASGNFSLKEVQTWVMQHIEAL
jgi:death-on-curing protein